MQIVGDDLLASLAAGQNAELKLIFNASGAIIFPATLQHRDQKSHGLSYEDDSQGNALAAMVRSGVVEVRHHQKFSDARVLEIWRQLSSHPALASLRSSRLTYQGRQLT